MGLINHDGVAIDDPALAPQDGWRESRYRRRRYRIRDDNKRLTLFRPRFPAFPQEQTDENPNQHQAPTL